MMVNTSSGIIFIAYSMACWSSLTLPGQSLGIESFIQNFPSMSITFLSFGHKIQYEAFGQWYIFHVRSLGRNVQVYTPER